MALRDAIRSWNPRQHVQVFAIGLGLVVSWLILSALLALAFFHPGAFIALITGVVFTYLLGAIFSVLLLERGVTDDG